MEQRNALGVSSHSRRSRRGRSRARGRPLNRPRRGPAPGPVRGTTLRRRRSPRQGESPSGSGVRPDMSRTSFASAASGAHSCAAAPFDATSSASRPIGNKRSFTTAAYRGERVQSGDAGPTSHVDAVGRGRLRRRVEPARCQTCGAAGRPAGDPRRHARQRRLPARQRRVRRRGVPPGVAQPCRDGRQLGRADRARLHARHPPPRDALARRPRRGHPPGDSRRARERRPGAAQAARLVRTSSGAAASGTAPSRCRARADWAAFLPKLRRLPRRPRQARPGGGRRRDLHRHRAQGERRTARRTGGGSSPASAPSTAGR